MKNYGALAVAIAMLVSAGAMAEPIRLEWDANPPEERVSYCVQRNGVTIPPCTTDTTADVEASQGDVLSVFARNYAGIDSEASDPVTVPWSTTPTGLLITTVITVTTTTTVEIPER